MSRRQLRQHAKQEFANIGDFRGADGMSHRIVMPLDRISLRLEEIARLYPHSHGEDGIALAVTHEYRRGVVARGALGPEAAFSREGTGQAHDARHAPRPTHLRTKRYEPPS